MSSALNAPVVADLTYENVLEPMDSSILEAVSKYYGTVLQKSDDLKTNACCISDGIPPRIKKVLCNIHDEVMTRYFGCGLTVPENLEGTSIVDLGCGAGRDVYTLAQLVGPTGSVTGVDMTDEQLEVARRTLPWHMEKFGYSKPNVQFLKSEIENLSAIPDASVDVVVSNCVVNLSRDKRSILNHVYRILKPGGEMYFSDMYASQRVPMAIRYDPELHGEGLAGSLYWNDFIRLAGECGFPNPRVVKDRRISVLNERVQQTVGATEYYSATYRLFKVEGLEPDAENYGQAVIYQGTIPECAAALELDDFYRFPAGQVVPVCGNTFRILRGSRFASHFNFVGDFTRHHGIFSAASRNKGLPFKSATRPAASASSSCCAPGAGSSTTPAASSSSCCDTSKGCC